MNAGPQAPLRLKSAMRLKTQHDFARIKAQGRRVVHGCMIANWLPLPPQAIPQLGVVTSRRLGNSVVRSRARRLLRETFRLHQHQLRQPVAVVLIARSSIVGQSLAAVEGDYLRIMRRGGLLLELS
jgi:ribonuclease P protein component